MSQKRKQRYNSWFLKFLLFHTEQALNQINQANLDMLILKLTLKLYIKNFGLFLASQFSEAIKSD